MVEEVKEKKDSGGNLSICVLASGSKGNAIYISDGVCSILVDAGLSGKAIECRMREKQLDPASLDAILVSHEHSDHIQGVGVLSRRYKLPVYIAESTLKAAPQLGRLHETNRFESGHSFSICGLHVHPFSISHDAADPSGFTFQKNGTKIGIATDLGIVTNVVKEHLKDCSVLVLEANHDPDLLLSGPYPWPLKQRIKSRSGHLSNQDTRSLLSEIQHERLKYVVLAHLSEINNTPDSAYQTVGEAISRCRAHLSVALQDRCGELIRIAT